MYGVLTVMAFGDGYGIYQTLLSLIQTDTTLVQLFTFALTLGAVAGAHEVGRLVRSRREGRGGHPAWIATLATLWLAVGGGISWLRIMQPLGSSDVAGLEALQFGLLLLGLYLLTGALAITTAYRFGSQRDAELRALLRDRARADRDANDYRHNSERVEALAGHLTDERQRRVDEHANGDALEAFGVFLKSAARFRQAEHNGDPRKTDELIPPPHPGPGSGP